VAEAPEMLTLGRHRDLEGREKRPFGRRALLSLVGVFCLLGLLNVFGQRPQTHAAAAPAASLEVYSPERVRSGLIFESRFHIRALDDLEEATIVLDSGWLEGMTLNTVEPAPVGESSRDGRLALELGHIPAGEDYLLFLQFQVNPTNVGHRSQDVQLYDGDERLLTIDRSVTIFP
jgi:hypothetical protein